MERVSYVLPFPLHPYEADNFRAQSGAIEQSAPLLQLEGLREYNDHILVRAAKSSSEADRIPESIKLYNLAGDYSTVIAVLAHALGNTIAQPSVDEKARAIEKTAADILRHYERTNRAVGKERDAVIRLLRVRAAMDAKDAGRVDTALEVNFDLLVWRVRKAYSVCSSWSLRTSCLWMGTLRRSQSGQKSSANCQTRCNATCRRSLRSRWTSLLPSTRR